MNNSNPQKRQKRCNTRDRPIAHFENTKRALPVASSPQGDQSAPPISGEEYLRRVRVEAMKCAGTVVADLPPTYSTKIGISYSTQHSTNSFKRTVPSAFGDQNPSVPKECEYDMEWKENFVEWFNDLRESYQLFMDQARNDKDWVNFIEASERLIPKSLKKGEGPGEKAWKAFCYGENRENPSSGKRLSSSNDDGVIDEKASMEQLDNQGENTINAVLIDRNTVLPDQPQINSRAAGSNAIRYPPHLSILAALSHRQTVHLLRLHNSWISDDNITKAQSEWIFALLVKLDKLLTGDELSILRELAKKCSKIRDVLANQRYDPGATDGGEVSNQIAYVNMIIAIVSGYFGQLDLL
ncbi:survival motor neuron interacting protein 1-domain-containing protein [Paraphysoderma sedebokerense]|nr:survival motor neuron interacting protein 1-domain-containing protein [Paraphysoderma sedebokerense]